MNRRLRATALAAALAVTSVLGGTVAAAPAHADPAPTVPFTDPAVRGGLLLEDASHTPVTSGTLQADPTFPFTVASDLGRAGDSVATLIVATPRSGQTPDGYTQDQLNDSEPYPVSTRPTNTGGAGRGLTLGEYINLDRSARQNSTDAYAGLYQLRMNTGGPNRSDDASYYQAVIKVTETGVVKDANGLQAATGTWQLVEPLVTTTSLAVSPAGSSVSGTPVTLTSTTSESAPGAVGTVQFLDGTTKLGAPVQVNATSGVASTTVTPTVGSHSFSAVFTPGDATKFDPSTTAATAYTVNASTGQTVTTTTLSVTPASPQPSGTQLTLTSTTTPAAAGSVTFYDGGSPISSTPQAVDPSSGQATLAMTPAAGMHSFTAVFTPSNAAAYSASDSNGTPQTFAISTPTMVSLSADPSTSPQPSGSKITLTAAVAPAVAGTVTFSDGSSVVGTATTSAGAGTVSAVVSPSDGDHSFTATFTPDDPNSFAPSVSQPVALTTGTTGGGGGGGSGRNATATTIVGSPAPGTLPGGTSVTVTSTTSPHIAGSLQLLLNGTATGSPATVDPDTGSASVTVIPPVGNDRYTATFTPSDAVTYAPSTSTNALAYTVTAPPASQRPTTTTITAGTPSPQQLGTSVVLTSTTAPAGPGTVQFTDGTTAVGSPVTVSAGTGSASVSVTPTQGDHSYAATFTPFDLSLLGPSRSAALPYTITAPPPGATASTLTAAQSSPQPAGTPIVLTSTTSPKVAGSVQFLDAGVPVGGAVAVTVTTGQASVTVSPPVGSHTFSARFSPTDTATYAPSTSPVLTFVVTVATTTTLASVSQPPGGGPVTLTSHTVVTGGTTGVPGNVQFLDGTGSLAGPVPVDATGTATLTTTGLLPDGTRAFSAVFTPSDPTAYAPSTGQLTGVTITRLVTAIAVTVGTAPSGSSPAGTPVALNATVTPAQAGSVEFFDGAADAGPASYDAGSGRATLTVRPSAGQHAYSAQFIPADLTRVAPAFSPPVGFLAIPVPAVVSAVSPASAQRVSATSAGLTVSATVTDPSGLSRVTSQLDSGAQHAMAARGNYYADSESLHNVKLGSHRITIRATEAGAGLTTTVTRSFTLYAPSTVAAPGKAYSPAKAPGNKRTKFSTTRFAGAPGGVGYVGGKGASDTFRFFGNGLDLHFGAGATLGEARVLVDGKLYATVDLYAAAPGSLTKTVRHLAYGVHTVQVVNAGARDRRSRGTNVVFGFFLARQS